VSGNEEFLREKAKLLIARERELLALRRKHKRLALWLALAQGLAELVDPKLELAEVCRRVSDRMVGVLDLHQVSFFELDGARLRRVGAEQTAPGDASELAAAAAALLAAEASGMCVESGGEAQAGLARAVGLHRFLWHRMPPVAGPPVVFVAGYDRERAQFFAPFDEDDVAHFTNTAHQLALLLANNDLVRQLERDKRALQEFNVELERRVAERTSELAATNRELEQAFDSLRQKDRRLAEDIEEARLFQQKVLADVPRTPGLDVATSYQPLERVGGDVFDVCEVRPGVHRVFLADATGHGVQASMRTILMKTEYDRLKTVHASVRALLEELNTRLVTLFPGGEMMSTGCCVDVTLDGAGAKVAYANAGNAPLVHWSGATARTVYADSPFLGVCRDGWSEPLTFLMRPGDLLLVASDGLAEQRNDAGAAFEDALARTALDAGASAAAFIERLLGDFHAFRGGAPIADDITLLALRVPEDVTKRS